MKQKYLMFNNVYQNVKPLKGRTNEFETKKVYIFHLLFADGKQVQVLGKRSNVTIVFTTGGFYFRDQIVFNNNLRFLVDVESVEGRFNSHTDNEGL